jgi:hypothetical protein
MDHAGVGFGLLSAWTAPHIEHVHIDTSAHTAKRLPPQFVDFMHTKTGRRKTLFGTNYPMISPAAALEDLGTLDLDAETTALYLEGNARIVFGSGGPAPR